MLSLPISCLAAEFCSTGPVGVFWLDSEEPLIDDLVIVPRRFDVFEFEEERSGLGLSRPPDRPGRYRDTSFFAEEGVCGLSEEVSPRGEGRGKLDFKPGDGVGFCVFFGRGGVDVVGVLSSELRGSRGGDRLPLSILAERGPAGFVARRGRGLIGLSTFSISVGTSLTLLVS